MQHTAFQGLISTLADMPRWVCGVMWQWNNCQLTTQTQRAVGCTVCRSTLIRVACCGCISRVVSTLPQGLHLLVSFLYELFLGAHEGRFQFPAFDRSVTWHVFASGLKSTVERVNET